MRPGARAPLRSLAVVLGLLAVGGWLLLAGLRAGWDGWGRVILGLGVLLTGTLALLVWWFLPAAQEWTLPLRTRLRDLLGRSTGVRDIARRLGAEPADLRTLRPRYREAWIPKRSGGRRRLLVPDDATKAIQRRILHRLLRDVPAHPAAYAFERGRSIAHQAAQHVGRAVVIRLDVVEFFATTHAGRILRMFLRLGFSWEASRLLTRLTTHEDGLPQGAPTSPRLANLVNRGLDADLTARLARRHGRYTRYADDVTVSFPENRPRSPARTVAAVKHEFGRRGYRLHERRKLSVRRRHQRQEVCGLVVNDRVALPREIRRRLRAVRHHLATGRSATLTPRQLEGWDAYARMVKSHGRPPGD